MAFLEMLFFCVVFIGAFVALTWFTFPFSD